MTAYKILELRPADAGHKPDDLIVYACSTTRGTRTAARYIATTGAETPATHDSALDAGQSRPHRQENKVYQVINCTPYPVRILRSVLPGSATYLVSREAAGASSRTAALVESADGPCWVIPRSGFRLAAQASVSGPPIGARVIYSPDALGHAECDEIAALLSCDQGVINLVVCSEISARAYYRRLSGGAENVRVVWPVFAAAAVALPPASRWSDALATIHEEIENGVEVDDTAPYWERAASARHGDDVRRRDARRGGVAMAPADRLLSAKVAHAAVARPAAEMADVAAEADKDQYRAARDAVAKLTRAGDSLRDAIVSLEILAGVR